MKVLVMLVLAIAASASAGLLVAALLAEWTRADMGFILVFFALGIAIFATLVVLLFAIRRPFALRAIDRSAGILLLLCAAVTTVLALNALSYGIETGFTWNELKLIFTIGAVSATAVVAQWIVVRFIAKTWPDRPPLASPRPETAL